MDKESSIFLVKKKKDTFLNILHTEVVLNLVDIFVPGAWLHCQVDFLSFSGFCQTYGGKTLPWKIIKKKNQQNFIQCYISMLIFLGGLYSTPPRVTSFLTFTNPKSYMLFNTLPAHNCKLYLGNDEKVTNSIPL